MAQDSAPRRASRTVHILVDAGELEGDLTVVENPQGMVLFAHGSGSSRHSPRNRSVAGALQDVGLSTLLFDLLTPTEELLDARNHAYRFDIGLLAERLVAASRWLRARIEARDLRLGYFGASTGAAAALVAAAWEPDWIAAVVSRGGRPDLAGSSLGLVRAPTLLIVGGEDKTVLELNRKAFTAIHAEKRLEIVPGATHLFEEPGALETVSSLAADWFVHHLRRASLDPRESTTTG
jgi:pimeloyl-ACP methyl ester carboxylesterase